MDPEKQSLSIAGLVEYFRDLKAWAWRIVLFLFYVLKKYILILLLAAGAAGTATYLLHRNEKPVFDVKMCCIFINNHQRMYGEMIAQLNQLIQSGGYADAAAILGMPEEKIGQIASIAGITVNGGRLEEDFSDVHYSFYITANLYDRSVAAQLEKGVLNYLNHNNQSYTELLKNKQKWKSRIAFYDQQLAKLDSLKEAIRVSYIDGQNTNALAQKENSVVDIYKLSDTLSYYKSDLQNYDTYYESVTKVYGFMPRQYPAAADRKPAIVKNGMTAFVAAWLFLGLLAFVRTERRKASI